MQCTLIFIASWLTCLLCDRVILINRADYAAAERFIPKRKLALIAHGLTPISFLPRREARALFAQKLGRPIPHDTILIGTIAELTKNKGVSYLIESVRNLQSATCNLQTIIIGEGENRAELEKQIDAHALHNKVCLIGFIPDASRYLKGFDTFALPSIKEGLPYALMQAMAAGLPVVAARVGGIPDLITDREDGLIVPPKDPAQLTAALEALCSSPLRREIGARARQKIKTKFPFCAMIENTIAIYDLKTHK